MEELRRWVGRSEVMRDVVTPGLVDRFRATFDDTAGPAAAGDVAPQALHWCLAPSHARQSDLGPDGHPARGGFLPPAPLPRRMWAGSELTFEEPLRVGDEVERRSTLRAVDHKHGRAGDLVFMTVEHEYFSPRGRALVESLKAVYRGLEGSSAEPPPPAPEAAEISRSVEADPVLLFRYSALTFNGHRIHYDRPYTTRTENYPGLLVHGPLQATLLLRLAADMKGAPLARASIRAQSPLFDSGAFEIRGRRTATGVETWTIRDPGPRNMTIFAA